MSPHQTVLTASRSWTEAQLEALYAEGFPAFITADAEVRLYIDRVREVFGDFNLTLIDEGGEPVATGWGVPITWSGATDELPTTFARILAQSLSCHDTSARADTFVIAGVVVHPSHKGTGTAVQMLEALTAVATTHGLDRVVAPVRPTRKRDYPLLDATHYASWVREDGLPWDPWLRLHVRMGATIVGVAPRAQTMTGTLAQWREWTGLEFPRSGDYTFAEGMAPLRVDLTEDQGTYVEANVWVRHR